MSVILCYEYSVTYYFYLLVSYFNKINMKSYDLIFFKSNVI